MSLMAAASNSSARQSSGLYTVLVTRPEHQAAALCEQLQQAGANTYHFPVIDIQELSLSSSQRELLANLVGVDMLIFISANAVRLAARYLPQATRFPGTVKLAAIGNATARAMHEHSLPIHVKPPHRFDSEALLSLPELQSLQGKHIVLIKGQGGRTVLADTLQQRGARLGQIEIYQRIVTKQPFGDLLKHWQAGDIQIQTITSVETLQSLLQIAGSENEHLVRNTPMVVISERVKDYAIERKVTAPIIVAKQASDEAMVNATIELLHSLSE